MQHQINPECETRLVSRISLVWQNWNLFKKACGFVIAISMILVIAASGYGQTDVLGLRWRGPVDIAVEADGNLVVVDISEVSVVRVDKVTGNRTLVSSDTVGTGPALLAPVNIAVEADGSLVVLAIRPGRVIRVDAVIGNREVISSDTVGTGASFPEFPSGIAVGADGNLLVGNAHPNNRDQDALVRVDAVTGNREVISSDTVGGGSSFPSFANDIAVETDGSVVMVDIFRSVVVRVDTATGDRTVISSNTVGTGPNFSSWGTIAVEADGNLVVLNYNNGGELIRVNANTGDRTVISSNTVGSGPNFGLSPNTPQNLQSIAVEADGKLVVLTPGLKRPLIRVNPVTGDRVILSDADGGKFVTTPGDGEEPPTEEAAYTVELSEGINLISVPLNPGVDWRLSDLARHIGPALNFIVWYDHATKRFVSYFPDFPQDSPANKMVSGGDGYIAQMKEAKSVTFSGSAWNDAIPAAPPLHQTGATVLVVDGVLFHDESGTRLNGVKVIARNKRTGAVVEELTGALGTAGAYTLTFANLAGKRVAEVGDQLEISLLGQGGTAMSEPIIYQLTAETLRTNQLTIEPLWVAPIPKENALFNNYPNPFNPETWIPYQLAERADVSIEIYETSGRLVRTLKFGQQPAGTYLSRAKAAYWDGRNLIGERVTSGVYFYVLKAGSFSQTKKMVILK